MQIYLSQIDSYKDIIVKYFLEGKIIIIPTETVYGLCCLATNTEAVNKIYTLKNRLKNKPLSVLVRNISQINSFAILNKSAIPELKNGNTVILRTKINHLSDQIFGNKNNKTIGVRMPNNLRVLHLLSFINQPIVATSVNISGQKPVIQIKQNKLLADLTIIDDRVCGGKPSSIIDHCFKTTKIIR